MDIDAILAELSTSEKISLTGGGDFWNTFEIPTKNIPAIFLSDGPNGLRSQKNNHNDSDPLGLGHSDPATCFPTATCLASSWDIDLVHAVGVALGKEAVAQGVQVILGPGVNIKRHPLCGRNFEYYSEDPLLSGKLAANFIKGIQQEGVAACIKHFAANNQETDRMRVDARIDMRALREIYFPAFKIAVDEAEPKAIMCSYNKINGFSASENYWLLTKILRDEWKYDGLIISDWGAVYNKIPAVKAGLDLEMPPAPNSSKELAKAVAAGEVTEAELNCRVKNVLKLVFELSGLDKVNNSSNYDAHYNLARKAAAESIVLLANENKILPLPPKTNIVVVGEFALNPRYQGAGSSRVNPYKIDNPVEELTKAFQQVTYIDSDDLSQNKSKLKAADAVICFIGLPAEDESEGFDRREMNLPHEQIELLQEITKYNKKIISVLMHGGTVLLQEIAKNSWAVLDAWLGGEAVGGAIADVISGKVNPSGRLAETIPFRLEDTPAYCNFPGYESRVEYGENIFVGYRYYDYAAKEVMYPFGYGLSYTDFVYSDLNISSNKDGYTVEVTLKNVGNMPGAEVIQLYVSACSPEVIRPVRELKKFKKIFLEPSTEQKVSFILTKEDFCYWSEKRSEWCSDSGKYHIEFRKNAKQSIIGEVIDYVSDNKPDYFDEYSTIAEIFADKKGRKLLEKVSENLVKGLEAKDVNIAIIRDIPLKVLANFGLLGFNSNLITELLQKLNNF